MLIFLFGRNFDNADTLRILIDAVFVSYCFAPAHRRNLDKDYWARFDPRIPHNIAYSVDPRDHNSALLDLWSASHSVSRPAISPNSMAPSLPRLNFVHLFLFIPLLFPHLHSLFVLWPNCSFLPLKDFT